MLKVIAEDFIMPEFVNKVLPLYQELVEKTRQEEKCISYNLYQDRRDSSHFIFIEEWPNQAALDEHCKTEHFTRLVPLINAHQRKDGEFTFMEQRVEPIIR